MKDWYLYLVRTAKGALYTGITTDVDRRFAEHQAGNGARALRGKGPLTLAYSTVVGERGLAARLEWQVKQWPKNRKEALVRGGFPLPGLDTAGNDPKDD
ncbi:GIY-YIG nuclease family protein [Marinobacter mobilis]|uniref:Putative endonuclease n=1 Tax=Marinobacter mobilis TaxID=488533 RepID=A0A1H2T3H1_9GAMM|nr:GIY-YIG nuclease family protein [Marinobacter mobilis]SDW37804.1 putative endonuclease [Marinobacter mobilis]